MIGRNFIRRGKDSNINLPAEDDLNIGHGNENSSSAYCRLLLLLFNQNFNTRKGFITS